MKVRTFANEPMIISDAGAQLISGNVRLAIVAGDATGGVVNHAILAASIASPENGTSPVVVTYPLPSIYSKPWLKHVSSHYS